MDWRTIGVWVRIETPRSVETRKSMFSCVASKGKRARAKRVYGNVRAMKHGQDIWPLNVEGVSLDAKE